MDEVDELVSAWTAGLGKDKLAGRLRGAGVPCAPVREIGEVVTDPHLLERGMLRQIDHPQYGPLTVPHSPLHVGEYRAELEPSPALGQHNDVVYGGWLGLSAAEIRDLAEREVI